MQVAVINGEEVRCPHCDVHHIRLKPADTGVYTCEECGKRFKIEEQQDG